MSQQDMTNHTEFKFHWKNVTSYLVKIIIHISLNITN